MAEGGKSLGSLGIGKSGRCAEHGDGFKRVLEDSRAWRALETSGRRGCDSKGSGKLTEGLKLGSDSLTCSFGRSLWPLGRGALQEGPDRSPETQSLTGSPRRSKATAGLR